MSKVKVFKLILFTNNVKKLVAEKYCGYQKALNKKCGKFKEERAQDVPEPTKIFACSSSEDQRPTKNLHPHIHRKKMHCSNQPYKLKYSEEFIKIGFTYILINDEPRPQCVVYSEVLANENLKAGKLKRHLTAKHSKFIDKLMLFFRRLEKE